ncbi:transposase [Anoxybacillus suryakundensis]|uniref:REP element-mobilizing transposase RayT n=1 Tax=Anoxybacillus suryakundensis TaxID=1325335 RepID=A0A0K6GQ03_9BACL|nr:REP element-mobilizing transposase RayT [Anoxybacillus suryakundensis]
MPHLFYHIVCRGNRRDPLFKETNDFLAFLHILEQLHDKIPFEIASYCLMTNHFHLQLRSQQESISKVMALINKRYANYYNTRYGLTGHVFEKRYFSKIIDDDAGMLEVSRYIHLNPVEARMVHLPEHYRWSSFQFYYQTTSLPSFMNIDALLQYFSGTIVEKKKKYIQFVKADVVPNDVIKEE